MSNIPRTGYGTLADVKAYFNWSGCQNSMISSKGMEDAEASNSPATETAEEIAFAADDLWNKRFRDSCLRRAQERLSGNDLQAKISIEPMKVPSDEEWINGHVLRAVCSGRKPPRGGPFSQKFLLNGQKSSTHLRIKGFQKLEMGLEEMRKQNSKE